MAKVSTASFSLFLLLLGILLVLQLFCISDNNIALDDVDGASFFKFISNVQLFDYEHEIKSGTLRKDISLLT